MFEDLKRRQLLKLGIAAGAGMGVGPHLWVKSPRPAHGQGGTIKVGILHSLSGTMSISETSVVDAELLAIDQINAAGGILGRQIEPVVEDGSSDWPTFAERATKLIDFDRVATIFGCWTSASRKAVLPVFESLDHMLWYPVQYEGQECSKNIFYTGATPNQQIEPSVKWLFDNKGSEFFLVGSDYVFPRTANTIIKAQLRTLGATVVGEEYLRLGSTEVESIISRIQAALPNGGIIYNSLNGDSNIAFFRQLQEAGLGPEDYPSMSISIAEEEVQAIGPEFLVGHYAAWNYFMSVDTPANRAFVEAFRAKYGETRVTTDPMEAAYIMVNLWSQAVEAAGTAEDLDAVRQAAYGQTFDAPEGRVVMNTNHHLSKFVRVGQVQEDGQFEVVYASDVVDPLPWNQFVAETQGYGCDWSDPDKGGRYLTL